jgi:hypothetical protein
MNHPYRFITSLICVHPRSFAAILSALNFSPRLGFVWRIADKPTVLLRGGYGVYFNRLSAGLAENLLAQEPFSTFQFFAGASNGGATLQQPFTPLLPSNSLYPTWSPRIPRGGPSIAAISRTMTDPYTYEYNLNTQIALGRDYLLELGYVGTRSLHVAGCTEFNQAQLASPTGLALDASGSIGVTERTAYILRVRQLAVAIAKAWVETLPAPEENHGS